MNWIKSRVVLLPHNNQDTIITKYLSNNKLSLNNDILAPHTNQHLYITSNEEIKEGDWYYDLFPSGAFGVGEGDSITQCYNPQALDEGTYKIIATTNTSLKTECKLPNIASKETLGSGRFMKLLPQPSSDFIEEYIKEYNKGNIIENVLVDYEERDINPMSKTWKEDYIKFGLKHQQDLKLFLKISKDSTITIKKNKDSWNREEVELLLFKFMNRETFQLPNGNLAQEPLDDWIKENL